MTMIACIGTGLLSTRMKYWQVQVWQFGQTNSAIWTNTFCNLDKYILQFGQIHFAICTNTFAQLQAALSQYHAVQTMPIWSLANATHQMDITDAVRIWTPCHNDHIAYVATTHLITGTGLELRIWDPCHFDHLHRMARTCCQHRGRDRTLLCRGTHTHSPHLTHRGLGHIIRRRGSPT